MKQHRKLHNSLSACLDEQGVHVLQRSDTDWSITACSGDDLALQDAGRRAYTQPALGERDEFESGGRAAGAHLLSASWLAAVRTCVLHERNGGLTRQRRQNAPIDVVSLSLPMEHTPDGSTHGGRRLSWATSLELDAVRFQPFSQSLCFPPLQPFHSLCSSPLHVLPSDDSHVLSVKYDSCHQSRRRAFVAHQLSCHSAFPCNMSIR